MSLNFLSQLSLQVQNYYSHFVNESSKPDMVDGIDLIILTKKLRILLVCCILNFIGIDNEKINEIFNNSSLKI